MKFLALKSLNYDVSFCISCFRHWVLLKPSKRLHRNSELESTPLLKKSEDRM